MVAVPLEGQGGENKTGRVGGPGMNLMKAGMHASRALLGELSYLGGVEGQVLNNVRHLHTSTFTPVGG